MFRWSPIICMSVLSPLNWFSGSWVELHFGGSRSTSHHGSQEQIPTSAQEGDVEKMLLEAQRESGKTSSRGSSQCSRSAGKGEAQPGLVDSCRSLQPSRVLSVSQQPAESTDTPPPVERLRRKQLSGITAQSKTYTLTTHGCVYVLVVCQIGYDGVFFLVRWRFPRAEVWSRESDEKERWMDLGLVQPTREQPTKVWNVRHFKMIFFHRDLILFFLMISLPRYEAIWCFVAHQDLVTSNSQPDFWG